jgi:hypothetical protein
MKLRFHEKKIRYWADRYEYPKAETELIELRENVLNGKQLTKSLLRLVCRWKAPRSAGYAENNDNDFIKEITSFALNTTNERARIEVLTILDGVLWPTASVILHLFHSDRYPILDFRALWSVTAAVPAQYTFEFWRPYVEFCRDLARRNNVDMRTLDRALWQFSKENQPSQR